MWVWYNKGRVFFFFFFLVNTLESEFGRIKEKDFWIFLMETLKSGWGEIEEKKGKNTNFGRIVESPCVRIKK